MSWRARPASSLIPVAFPSLLEWLTYSERRVVRDRYKYGVWSDDYSIGVDSGAGRQERVHDRLAASLRNEL